MPPPSGAPAGEVHSTAPERRTELRKRIKQLIDRHQSGPTGLPPPTRAESDDRVEALERDLAQAERDKAALVRAADEGIGAIRQALEEERAQRAVAGQAVDELRPPDPNVLADEMAARLAEVLASGDAEHLDQLIRDFAADEVPAPVQAKLLKRLEAEHPDVALELARTIGREKYYKLLPEVVRLLDFHDALDSWRALLQAAAFATTAIIVTG